MGKKETKEAKVAPAPTKPAASEPHRQQPQPILQPLNRLLSSQKRSMDV